MREELRPKSSDALVDENRILKKLPISSSCHSAEADE
jgi:hypothetical protein